VEVAGTEEDQVKARTREYLTLTFAALSLAVVPVACAVWRLTNG
jgi:hypothetical protein